MAYDIERPQTIRELVERSTSEMLIQPDWEKNFLLVEEIRSDPATAPVIADHIRKRLLHSETDVVHLSLVLIETLMQNCADMIPVVNADNFQNTLGRIAMNTRAPFKTRNKTLDLIQVWAAGLKDYPLLRVKNNFVRTYQALRSKGIKFPPIGPDTAKYAPPSIGPQNPPPPSAAPRQQASFQPQPQQIPSSSGLSPAVTQQVQKMSEVQAHMDLVMEIFRGTDPHTERITDNELVKEMMPSLQDYAVRLRQWLEGGSVPEELFGAVIEMNDRLNQIHQCYDQLSKGQKPAIFAEAAAAAVAAAEKPNSPPTKTVTAFDLIDTGGGGDMSLLAPPPSYQASLSLPAPAPPTPNRTPSPLIPMPTTTTTTNPANPPPPSGSYQQPSSSPFYPPPGGPQPPAPSAPSSSSGDQESGDFMAEFGMLANRERQY